MGRLLIATVAGLALAGCSSAGDERPETAPPPRPALPPAATGVAVPQVITTPAGWSLRVPADWHLAFAIRAADGIAVFDGGGAGCSLAPVPAGAGLATAAQRARWVRARGLPHRRAAAAATVRAAGARAATAVFAEPASATRVAVFTASGRPAVVMRCTLPRGRFKAFDRRVLSAVLRSVR